MVGEGKRVSQTTPTFKTPSFSRAISTSQPDVLLERPDSARRPGFLEGGCGPGRIDSGSPLLHLLCQHPRGSRHLGTSPGTGL